MSVAYKDMSEFGEDTEAPSLAAGEGHYGAGKSTPQQKDENIINRLETLIENQYSSDGSALDVLEGLGTAIISVAVLDADEITSKVIGSPRSGETPVSSGPAIKYDHNTLFQACSISKPMAALATIKLCQEGILDLDKPISAYLPSEKLGWVSNPWSHDLVSQITLRLLLSHTAGLSTGGFGGYSSTQIPTLKQTLTGEPPANNEPVTLLYIPGQRHSYSGGGYTVIQLILETVLRKPFYQILDEVVLRPLSMTRSTYEFLPAGEKNYAPAYLTGKLKADPDHHSQPESAAAGLWTTPSDLLRAIQAVQLSLKSDDFLETDRARIMLTKANKAKMALGWAVTKTNFSHSGSNDPGYRCFVAGYGELSFSDPGHGPDAEEDYVVVEGESKAPDNAGVCIMTSSALGFDVVEKTRAAIAYLKGWPSLDLNPFIPFIDRSQALDIRAKEWFGVWKDGDWIYTLAESVKGVNTTIKLRMENEALSMKAEPSLFMAAITPQSYAEGLSVDVVVQGLEMMLRLGWKEGSRSIEVWVKGGRNFLSKLD